MIKILRSCVPIFKESEFKLNICQTVNKLCKKNELPLRHRVFPTPLEKIVLLGVSPLPALWGMGRVAQKRHLSFVVVFWYAGNTKIRQKVMIKANNCNII